MSGWVVLTNFGCDEVFMKSLRLRGVAGNVKLRGKREKLLTCGCCTVQDFRWGERIRQAKREIATAQAPSKAD